MKSRDALAGVPQAPHADGKVGMMGDRMQRLKLIAALLLGAVTLPAEAAPRPDFLVIIADDLGFTDLGAYGGDLRTPNLDRLAAEGLRLDGFHVSPTCSPTRAMLFSGTGQHRAGLGSMVELMTPNQRGRPGYLGHLSPDVASMGEIFAGAGYRTLYSGKWHLGTAPAQDPHARGFGQSFALLQAGHNHFGLGLSTDPMRGDTYTENGRIVTALPRGFYSSVSFTDRLIDGLAATPGEAPVLAVLSFTAPHWPLQAPPEAIARWRGRFDQGFEARRDALVDRQRARGILPAGARAHPIDLRPEQRWAALPAAERAKAARAMEVYAAMVEVMDANVGRVIAELKRQGRYDRTVILFLSDNGAEGIDLEGLARRPPPPLAGPPPGADAPPAGAPGTPGTPHGGGARGPSLNPFLLSLQGADNRLANFGAATSFIGYGPGWAQAGTGASWLYKAFQTEGGTRVPAILKLPGSKPGATAAYLHVKDVLPTFMALADIPDHGGRFAGRSVEPIRGRSWEPFLAGRAPHVYGPQDSIGGELFGSRQLRLGDWKLTDIGDGRWRLFHIATDPGETDDRAAAEPARLAAMARHWDAWAKDAGVILPDRPLFVLQR
jgi:arylsulfatase